MYIEEKIETKAPAKKIWQAWMDAYKRSGHEGAGIKEGAKGKLSAKGKEVPFEIVDVKKNETFTTVWKSFLVKFIFIYNVKSLEKGSEILCRVKVRGPLGFLVAPFLKKKIRNNVRQFLEEFAMQLEQSPRVMFKN